MPLYESVFIARPDITAAQVETLTNELKSIIDDNGGSVGKSEYWGLKSLAYRIKKNRKGHYSLLNLDAPPAAITEMERNMRLNEDVLRFMTVRVDELEEGPSIMMQSRSRDGGRGRYRDRGGRDHDRDRGGRGRDGGKPDDAPKAEAKAEAKPEAKAEAKPEAGAKAETKPEAGAKADDAGTAESKGDKT